MSQSVYMRVPTILHSTSCVARHAGIIFTLAVCSSACLLRPWIRLVDHCGCDVLDSPQPRTHGLPRGYDRRPIHWAARNGHTSVCRWLIDDQRVPVDFTTSDGTSALHLAASQGHVLTCRYLVEQAGAGVNLLNDHGCSGIHSGALHVNIFLKNDADTQ